MRASSGGSLIIASAISEALLVVAGPGQGEHQVQRAELGLRVLGQLFADVAALAVMGHRGVAVPRAKVGRGDVVMREGDVHLGQHRCRLGLQTLEKPVQGLLVMLAGDLRVTRVDQLVVAELLERQKHVALGLGLVGVLRGDFPAELERLLEMLAGGLGFAERDAQVAELVAKPGAFAAGLDLIGQRRERTGRAARALRDSLSRALAGSPSRSRARAMAPSILATPRFASSSTARAPAIAGEGRGPGRRT